MKSGLLNVCNLNTVLMLVILGLVIYCCVRQSKENFNLLQYSALMSLCNKDIQPGDQYRACHNANTELGTPTPEEIAEIELEALKRQ